MTAVAPTNRRRRRSSRCGRIVSKNPAKAVSVISTPPHYTANLILWRTLSVFLVDDHELFLSGVRSELGDTFDVLGSANDVDDAIAQILDLRPDVVLVDVHMPGGGGLAVINRVTDVIPDATFLVLSVSDAAEDVIAMIRAGARGYLTKSIAPGELGNAVRRVNDGDAVFPLGWRASSLMRSPKP